MTIIREQYTRIYTHNNAWKEGKDLRIIARKCHVFIPKYLVDSFHFMLYIINIYIIKIINKSINENKVYTKLSISSLMKG
jgi:hypothetical protein